MLKSKESMAEMIFNSVLIIDDDPTQVAIMQAYFESLKVTDIKGTINPSEALNYINNKKNEIDLIVSDLQMPEMDGLEFLRHLNSMKYTGKLAIISGVKSDLLDHASRLAKMHRLNIIGHVPKPVTKSSLDNVFLKEIKDNRFPLKTDQYFITQNDFSRAMEHNEIEPYYQPKVDVKTGRIIGAEALVRWNKPGMGFISPEVLINFAETNGRIEELTFYLFNKTLKSSQAFLAFDPKQVFATNLSPNMARNLSLPDQLLSRIKAYGLNPTSFSFEVTENNVLNLDTTTLEVLSRLRILEFDVAIDDFGTGSSNIQTLRDFPYSELKIDQAFVSNAVTDVFSRETVRAAVSLSHDRGMTIVAEGIEDIETFVFIRDQGIEFAQGYLFSKALNHDDYLAFIKTYAAGFDIEDMIANVAA
jgi:EAL domain-containing protein (putative c-di-GMP-specific phosphodiesterase class I)/ActR/RegA family two-component response regulator